MSGGGSGGNSTQTTQFKPPDYAQPGWEAYLSGVQNLSQQPMQMYNGQQLAELNPYQLGASDMVRQRSVLGAPDLNAARGQVTDTTQGAYLGYSPGMNSNVQPGLNPYYGPNPYLQDYVGKQSQDMANAFATGTAANTDAMFSRSGAFGGSAHQATQQGNAANLAREVGSMANNAYMQDYNAQMGLGENAVNRDLQAQQYNTGQAQTAWDAERSRQMQAAGLTGTLSQDDWTAANAMQAVGNNQNTYEQKMLDAAYNQFQSAQQYPYAMADLYANALARASGGMGSNTTVYQGTQSSPLMNTLGTGAALYGLLGR